MTEQRLNSEITISKLRRDRIKVSFPYNYSAGLRVGEVVKLKPEDIDSKKMLIYIKDSKGRKDRYTLLSEKALNVLRQYWTEYKPQKWLFEGTKPERHISVRTVQKIFEHACKIAGVKKDT